MINMSVLVYILNIYILCGSIPTSKFFPKKKIRFPAISTRKSASSLAARANLAADAWLEKEGTLGLLAHGVVKKEKNIRYFDFSLCFHFTWV